MEDADGPRTAVEEEPPPDEAREAALALENARLDRGPGPQPDQRGFVAEAPNAPGPPADENEEDGNADDGQDVVEEPQGDLPLGVPAVEDVEESEAKEEGTITGVDAGAPLVEVDEEFSSAGVPGEDEDESAGVLPADKQLGGRRYPVRERHPPDCIEMHFFGRSENSPGDSSTPGLDLNIGV